MQQVTCYKTEDGKIFENKREALTHTASLGFKEWYRDNRIWIGCEPVEAAEILDWMQEHAVEILQYLNLVLKYKGFSEPSQEQQEEYAQKYKEYDDADHIDDSTVFMQ